MMFKVVHLVLVSLVLGKGHGSMHQNRTIRSLLSLNGLSCEEPFTKFQDGCYYMTKERMSYYTAKKFCKEMDAYLPTVKDSFQNLFIKYLARGKGVWIGLRKKGRIWAWLDKSPSEYRAWHWREPNKCCGRNVKCARMNPRTRTGTWADVSCESKNAVICKYNLEVRKPKCDAKYRLFNDFCYMVGRVDIAPIRSVREEEESNEVDGSLSNLSKKKFRRRRFRRHVLSKSLNVANGKNQLIKHGHSEKPRYNQKMRSLQLSQFSKLRVATPTSRSTDAGHQRDENRIKEALSRVSSTPQPLLLSSSLFNNPTPNQRRLSPSLSMPHSPPLPPLPAPPSSYFEKYEKHQNKTQHKRSKQPETVPRYTNSSHPSPSSYPLMPIRSRTLSHMQDRVKFLKSLPPQYLATFEPEVALPLSSLRSHQSLFRLRLGITMREAEEKCRADGAELASICSSEENEFVKGLVTAKGFGSAWFGLYVVPEMLSRGTWYREFTDKRRCSYRNWMSGKPDNFRSKNSMCTIFSPEGFWDDFDCNDKKYIRLYVCKKPARMVKVSEL